jgi:hypothetical protein
LAGVVRHDVGDVRGEDGGEGFGGPGAVADWRGGGC